jgi:putative oxidoreductase
MQRLHAPLMLLARVMMAAIFVVEGWSKIVAYDEIVGYMQQNGVPGGLLPLVIITELCGGVLVLIGFATRWAALALAGFCLLTALVFHRDFQDPMQAINFYKNVAMAGGFVALVAGGAGAWSVDAFRPFRRPRGAGNPWAAS